MTLTTFLFFWHAFVATHVCDVWRPDSIGLGNHVVYEGNCVDGFNLARFWHTIVSWTGIPPVASQGVLTFG